MSQQGPGGYGGGWGPPGGAGGAPGAPQGWGPQGPPMQPPYGAPVGGYGPPGGGPQPPKKTNPLVWIGIGCAVLAVLIVIGSGAVAFILARNAAKSGVAGAFSAAVELAVDGGAVTFDAGASTGALGGPTCERAVECCRRVLVKTGSSAEVIAGCDQLRTATELACNQALEIHSKSAPLLGTSCP